MNRFLLDTCTLIDWAIDPMRLSENARLSIADGRSHVFVSAVTAWEIAIKSKLGKLSTPDNVSQLLKDNRFQELPVTIVHANATHDLPLVHKDPFDRMLVAQSRVEKLALITGDDAIQKYDVAIIQA